MTLVNDIIDVIYTSMSHLSQPHYFGVVINSSCAFVFVISIKYLSSPLKIQYLNMAIHMKYDLKARKSTYSVGPKRKEVSFVAKHSINPTLI